MILNCGITSGLYLATEFIAIFDIIISHKMNSGAQLTSPSEPVCPGNRIIFTCQQPGAFAQWRIDLQPTLRQTVQSTQVGSVITFGVDRGFNFELHIVSNSSGILTTELQVTAVRELDGVRVDCTGSITFESTIQVVSVGELATCN